MSKEFDEKIARINALARKKKVEGLSPEELQEQKKLYRWYLDNIRASLSAQLDNVEFVDKPKS